MKAENTDLKARSDELAARIDRIEQLLANPDRRPQGVALSERGAAGAEAPRDQDAALARREGANEESTIKDAESSRWRRLVTSDNASAAGTLLGAAETVTQFAMHATVDGVAGLAVTILGVAALGLAKAEKKKGKNDDHPDQR